MIIVVPSSDRLTAWSSTLGPIHKRFGEYQNFGKASYKFDDYHKVG